MNIFYLFDSMNYFHTHRQTMIYETRDFFEHISIGALSAGDNMKFVTIGKAVFNRFNFVKFKFSVFAYVINLWRMFFYCRASRISVFYLVSIRCIVYCLPLVFFFPHSKFIFSFTGLGTILSPDSRTRGMFLLRFIVKFSLRLAFLFFHRNIIILAQNSGSAYFLSNFFKISLSEITITGGVGVDLDLIRPLEKIFVKPIRVIFIGRLVLDKGVKVFLDAAKKFTGCDESIQFVLVGDVDRLSPSALPDQFFDDYLQQTNITFLGSLSHKNVIHQIGMSDIICLPSFHEGFPRVLMEAAAAGRGIIASDIDGCKECVINGYNGILVKPGSSMDLENAFNFIINDMEIIKKFAINSRSLAELRFSEHLFVDVNRSVFSKLT